MRETKLGYSEEKERKNQNVGFVLREELTLMWLKWEGLL